MEYIGNEKNKQNKNMWFIINPYLIIDKNVDTNFTKEQVHNMVMLIFVEGLKLFPETGYTEEQLQYLVDKNKKEALIWREKTRKGKQ